jgi:hypothetical protein
VKPAREGEFNTGIQAAATVSEPRDTLLACAAGRVSAALKAY